MKRFLLIIQMLIVASMMCGCAMMIAPSEAEMAKFDYGEYPANYEDLVKQHMKNILFDPYSAQYQFMGTPSRGYVQNSPLLGGSRLIGFRGFFMVNAKNKFGAYVGNQKFGYLIRNNKVLYCEPTN